MHVDRNGTNEKLSDNPSAIKRNRYAARSSFRSTQDSIKMNFNQ